MANNIFKRIFSAVKEHTKEKFSDPLVQKGLISAIGGIGEAQRDARNLESKAQQIAVAPLLAAFDPKTTSALVAGQELPTDTKAPGAGVFEAIGGELLQRMFDKKKESGGVFSKAAQGQETPNTSPTPRVRKPGFKQISQRATIADPDVEVPVEAPAQNRTEIPSAIRGAFGGRRFF